MKRLLAGLAALLPSVAYPIAQPEPPLESHPVATVVFVVLFVGFCIGFAWMVWRKTEDKREEDERTQI